MLRPQCFARNADSPGCSAFPSVFPSVDGKSEIPEHGPESSLCPGNRLVANPRQSAWQAAACKRILTRFPGQSTGEEGAGVCSAN